MASEKPTELSVWIQFEGLKTTKVTVFKDADIHDLKVEAIKTSKYCDSTYPEDVEVFAGCCEAIVDPGIKLTAMSCGTSVNPFRLKIITDATSVVQSYGLAVRSRFEKMLKEKKIDRPLPEVMKALERHYPYHVLICTNSDNALDLYESAQLLPGSSTKKHILTQHGIAVDGPLSDQLFCLQASRDGVPSVIKLLKSEMKGALHREVSAVQALQDIMIDSIPLVPYKLIELVFDDSHTSTGHLPGTYSALISPRYLYSVAKMVPQPQLSAIVEGGKRIIQALEHIHSKGFVHMDVKADNIFVDYNGKWWLGDVGSTIQQGGIIEETSVLYTPSNIMGQSAETKYDWHMLAVTLLTVLYMEDAKSWEKKLIEGSHATPTKLLSAVCEVQDSSLLALLQDLLKRAKY